MEWRKDLGCIYTSRTDASTVTQRQSLKLIVKGEIKRVDMSSFTQSTPVTANGKELVFCAKALPTVH